MMVHVQFLKEDQKGGVNVRSGPNLVRVMVLPVCDQPTQRTKDVEKGGKLKIFKKRKVEVLLSIAFGLFIVIVYGQVCERDRSLHFDSNPATFLFLNNYRKSLKKRRRRQKRRQRRRSPLLWYDQRIIIQTLDRKYFCLFHLKKWICACALLHTHTNTLNRVQMIVNNWNGKWTHAQGMREMCKCEI